MVNFLNADFSTRWLPTTDFVESSPLGCYHPHPLPVHACLLFFVLLDQCRSTKKQTGTESSMPAQMWSRIATKIGSDATVDAVGQLWRRPRSRSGDVCKPRAGECRVSMQRAAVQQSLHQDLLAQTGPQQHCQRRLCHQPTSVPAGDSTDTNAHTHWFTYYTRASL